MTRPIYFARGMSSCSIYLHEHVNIGTDLVKARETIEACYGDIGFGGVKVSFVNLYAFTAGASELIDCFDGDDWQAAFDAEAFAEGSRIAA